MYINRQPLGRGSLSFGRRKRRFSSIAVVIYLTILIAALLALWRLDDIQPRVASALGPTPTPTLSVETLLAMGDEAYLDGDMPEAVAAYEQAITIIPGDYTLWARLSLMQTLANELENAVASADQAILLAPDEPDGHAARARALSYLGDYDGAVLASLNAIDLDPEYALAHAVLAESYADLGRLRQAREQAERAVELDPFSVESRRAFAYVLEYYGEYAGAAQQYQQALRLHPNRLDLWYGLGRNLRGSGQPEQAVATFLQWAIRDPQDPLPFVEIGKTYFEIRDDGAAQEYLVQAVELVCDDCPRTDYDLILSRLRGGESAIPPENVPTVDEMYVAAWRRLGMVYFTRRNYETSLEVFEELIAWGETHGEDIPLEAYYVTASAYYYLDECSIAIPRTLFALDLYEDGLLEDPNALKNILSIFVLCRDYAREPYLHTGVGFVNGFPEGYEEPDVIVQRAGAGTAAGDDTGAEDSTDE